MSAGRESEFPGDFFRAIVDQCPKVCDAANIKSICPDTFNMLIIFRHPLFRWSRMALSNDEIRSAAERLDHAEKTKQQIRQISLEHPGITIADSYAIQKAWVEMKVAEGRTVKGHKIGLTSKAMQSALNIDEPDSGVLLDDMFFADGGLVPTDRFIGTRVEAELAFIMKQRLAGPGCTMFDVLNATDFVVPALEILDTRVERVDPVTKSTRKIFDTIADNAANAGIVLAAARYGRWRPTCAGSARCAIATASWKKPASPPACSIIPPPAWPGSPTRSRHMASRLNPVRWCWRDRSFARSKPARVTPSRPITVPMAP
jgi:2-oxo-hept-3-ene-1,7-dioate hydratase